MLSPTRSFVCTQRGKEHFCCERCVHRAPTSTSMRCSAHRTCGVRFSGILWHAASAADLCQCPFGCWIKHDAMLAHVCTRIDSGPVIVAELGKPFANLALAKQRAIATAPQRRVYCIAETGPFVQVVVRRSTLPPVGVRVVLPCHTRADWVCVTWRHAGDGDLLTKQHVLVTPHSSRDEVAPLLPTLTYNGAAQPSFATIVSVRSVESCVFTGPSPLGWSSFFGGNWLVWSALARSPCASARYPYVNAGREKHPLLPEGCVAKRHHVAVQGPCPAQLPAHTDEADGGATCAFCCVRHSSIARFIAECAPDAILA